MRALSRCSVLVIDRRDNASTFWAACVRTTKIIIAVLTSSGNSAPELSRLTKHPQACQTRKRPRNDKENNNRDANQSFVVHSIIVVVFQAALIAEQNKTPCNVCNIAVAKSKPFAVETLDGK